MESEKEKKSYEYLTEYYDTDVMKSRLLYWHRAAQKVIKDLGLEDVATVNSDALLRATLCYFADIVRVRDFHDIELINESKRYAFGAFWFLRLHPVQITSKLAKDKAAFINERIVVHVIASEFLSSSSNSTVVARQKQFVHHFFHHLKYRAFNARTLELTLDALKV